MLQVFFISHNVHALESTQQELHFRLSTASASSSRRAPIRILKLAAVYQEHGDNLCVLFSFSHALLPHSLPNFLSSSTESTSGPLMHAVLTVQVQILLSHHRGSS